VVDGVSDSHRVMFSIFQVVSWLNDLNVSRVLSHAWVRVVN